MRYKPIYILKNWINENNLVAEGLSKNLNAVKYLEEKPSKIDLVSVCKNKNASNLIINYISDEKLNWSYIAQFSDSQYLLNYCIDKVGDDKYIIIKYMFQNPNAYNIIINYLDDLDNIGWSNLSKNTHPLIIKILEKNLDKVDIINLCANSSAVHIIEKYIDTFFSYDIENNKYIIDKKNKPHISKNYGIYYEINYCLNAVATNKNAFHIIQKYIDYMDTQYLCKNLNSDIVLLIKVKIEQQGPHNFFKEYLQDFLKNPYLIDLISDYSHFMPFLNSNRSMTRSRYKIPNLFRLNSGILDSSIIESKYWESLSENPNIFQLDIRLMKNQCRDFAEELAAYVFHPDRLSRISNTFDIPFDVLLEIY